MFYNCAGVKMRRDPTDRPHLDDNPHLAGYAKRPAGRWYGDCFFSQTMHYSAKSRPRHGCGEKVTLRIVQSGSTRRYAQSLAAALLAIVVGWTAHGAADVRIIDRFAGAGNGDTGPASSASMQPAGVAVDSQGNVFFADVMFHSVRRIDAVTGIITTVAGSGAAGDAGDGGSAVDANLRNPSDVEVDTNGNLYIADRGNHKIKRVAAGTGIIQTIAGTGEAGYSGDGGQATAAKLNNPTSIAVEADGTVFIADTTNDRIRQVLPNGMIRTIAGNGVSGYAGDGGPAAAARLGRPWGMTLDSNGNIYFAELLNQRIRVVHRASETINTFAGNGQFAFCDNVAPLNACFKNPSYVAYDSGTDAIFVSDSGNHRIRRIPRSGGNVTTFAGDGFVGFYGDGGAAIQARFNGPGGIAARANLGVYLADEFNYRLRRIGASSPHVITTIAGNGNLSHSGDGGPAIAAKLKGPVALRTDENGNLYIADSLNQRVRRVDTRGMITTVAGNGNSGYSGDGGQATQASLTSPSGVAADRSGNVYISDTSNHRVRRVAPNGVITTIFGTGVGSSTGDNGPASQATVVRPNGLAVYENSTGTVRFLYVVEPSSHKIRRVDLNTNTVIRFAGTGSMGGTGDGGLAVNAQLAIPLDVAADADGNVYIADAGNHRIRKVSLAGIITTVAGNGTMGFAGDGGAATAARLSVPDGVDVDTSGNIYINDSSNLRVRVVTTNGTIHTAAGNGIRTGSIDGAGGNPLDDLGDGGAATAATFNQPAAVAVDGAGNLYVSDNTPSHAKDTVRWVENISTLYGAPPPPPPPPPQGGISGQVRHALTQGPIPAVNVKVAGVVTQNHVTSTSGNYAAGDLSLVNWMVEPWKQAGFASGAISPLDASYVLQYLVNARDLSPEQILACDVTGDGNLSALDATRIMQRALGSPAPFPAAESCGSDWLFFPNAASAQNQTQLPPLLSGGTTCRKGAVQFNPLAASAQGQDFLAVVIGDCTGNWNGGAGAATSALSRGRSAGAFDVVVGPERRNRSRVRLPISIGGQGGFNAVEARIGFDPTRLRPIDVRSRGADTQGALVSWRADGRGNVTVALASGRKIASPATAVVAIDFEILEPGPQSGIRSAQVRVDESEARVRVGRRNARR